jgi:dienelactone hydrolase
MTWIACCALGAPGAAQTDTATAPREAFILRAGGDTIAVERFSRTSQSAVGEMVVPSTGQRTQYTLGLADSDRVADVTVGDVRVAFRGDSAEITSNGVRQIVPVPRDALPWLNPSMLFVEQLVRRGIALTGRRAASVSIPIFNLRGGAVLTSTVTWNGRDSVIVRFPDVEILGTLDSSYRLVGATVPTQGIVVERREALDDRVGRPDYRAPPGAPYTAEDVSIHSSDGFTLAGTLTRPAHHGRVPAVIVVTGSGLQDRDEALPGVAGYRPFRQIADTLGRRGIAVLRLDDRGYGASTGDGQHATTADFADDIRSALGYLRHREDIDPSRLGLIGHSEGGLVALMVAARDSALRAIVTLACAGQPLRAVLRSQQRYVVEHDPRVAVTGRDSALRAASRALDSAAARDRWLSFAIDLDPLPIARRVRRPAVLLLQGETDRQVAPGDADRLAQALRVGGNHDVTVRLFPNTDHLFLADTDGNAAEYASLPSKVVPTTVLGAMADWLVARLVPEAER